MLFSNRIFGESEQKVSVDDITGNCPRCNSSNPKGSKYCNKCGFRIDNKITGTGTTQYNTPASAANYMTSRHLDNNVSMGQASGAEFLAYESLIRVSN